jgi:hypothetical protein
MRSDARPFGCSRETVRRRAGAAAALAGLLGLAAGAAAQDPAARPPVTRALLLSGGKSPTANVQSHFHHLQDMLAVLDGLGLPGASIDVFASDGRDRGVDLAVRDRREPRAWLLVGTSPWSTLAGKEVLDTDWGDRPVSPAHLSDLREWFATAGRQLAPGDTLFLFVTDHGERGDESQGGGVISLWMEDLSVVELRALLATLPEGVRVVSVMSQCFSGSFADALVPPDGGPPSGGACGFFSTTGDRKAHGCFPEGRDQDRIGHAFRFIDALGRQDGPRAAHEEVLLTDDEPDVPVRTSDLHLRRVLEAEAERRGAPSVAVADAELAALALEADGTAGAEADEALRLAARVAGAYGLPAPASLAEVERDLDEVQSLADRLDDATERWERCLDELRRQNLSRFQAAVPTWRARLDASLVLGLDAEGRRALLGELAAALEGHAQADAETWRRLQRLREQHDLARGALQRARLRLAVTLRLRLLLERSAGLRLVARGGFPGADAACATLLALLACEATSIGRPAARAGEPPPLPRPLPALAYEHAVLARVTPSWLGVRYRQPSREQRSELDVGPGAVLVEEVLPDSGASRAGLLAGDVLLGPPDAPFTEPQQLREWSMTAPPGTPLPLRLLRGGQPLDVALTLTPRED